jgi:hypothetical protein
MAIGSSTTIVVELAFSIMVIVLSTAIDGELMSTIVAIALPFVVAIVLPFAMAIALLFVVDIVSS